MDKIKKWLCCAVRILRDCDLLPKILRQWMGGKEAKKFSPIKSLPKGPGRSAWIKSFDLTLYYCITIFVLCGVIIGGLLSGVLSASVVVVLSFLAVPLCLTLFCLQKRKADDFLLGSQGEREAAFWLGRVGRPDWRVIHDFQIAEGKANIDHIVVCLKGVFCIETKTLRKEHGKPEEIHFIGGKIYRGDRLLDKPDPVKQVTDNARDLHDFIRGKTGETGFVKRVVVFPKWFVTKGTQMEDTTVTNPELLVNLLEDEEDKPILTSDQVSRIADAIESENEFRLDD